MLGAVVCSMLLEPTWLVGSYSYHRDMGPRVFGRESFKVCRPTRVRSLGIGGLLSGPTAIIGLRPELFSGMIQDPVITPCAYLRTPSTLG